MTRHEENRGENQVLDDHYQNIELRPVDFEAVAPLHPRSLTLRGTYDSENVEAQQQRFEILATARIDDAAALVSYCRNLRVWFDASPADGDLIEAVQNLEAPSEVGAERPSIEDVLGLEDDDDDEEHCHGTDIVIAMALVEGQFDENTRVAVRFVVDPYIGNEDTDYYTSAMWARMNVTKGRCALRGVPNGPILRTAPESSGWRKGDGQCSVRGKWESNNYVLGGGWELNN